MPQKLPGYTPSSQQTLSPWTSSHCHSKPAEMEEIRPSSRCCSWICVFVPDNEWEKHPSRIRKKKYFFGYLFIYLYIIYIFILYILLYYIVLYNIILYYIKLNIILYYIFYYILNIKCYLLNIIYYISYILYYIIY